MAIWTSSRIGGAKIDNQVAIPAEPGALILMNHQSLLDIPVAFEFTTGGYSKVVTRTRYSRKIPLVSHMLRLYGHPLVDPGRDVAAQLARLRALAATTTHPLLIFPEGSRTRDGEIRPFRTAGLEAILAARRWKVYVVVVEGLWNCAKLVDYVRNISSVRARVESAGPFESPGREEAPGPFIERMRGVMCDKLHEMRRRPTPRRAGQE